MYFCKELLQENQEQLTRMAHHMQFPIWYILDEEDNIIFNTGDTSVKAKNIRRNNRVSQCVDDQFPLYSFVTIDGIAEIISNEPTEVQMG